MEKGGELHGKTAETKTKASFFDENILIEKTDEDHPMALAKIIEALGRNSITAERKSLYDDLEALRSFGLDIVKTGGKHRGYYIASRSFLCSPRPPTFEGRRSTAGV